jgi:hypothetical protein
MTMPARNAVVGTVSDKIRSTFRRLRKGGDKASSASPRPPRYTICETPAATAAPPKARAPTLSRSAKSAWASEWTR